MQHNETLEGPEILHLLSATGTEFLQEMSLQAVIDRRWELSKVMSGRMVSFSSR